MTFIGEHELIPVPQITEYAHANNVEWVLITNGNLWVLGQFLKNTNDVASNHKALGLSQILSFQSWNNREIAEKVRALALGKMTLSDT